MASDTNDSGDNIGGRENGAAVNPTRLDAGRAIARIIIDFDPGSGNVSVTGPIHNAILFLGMLKMAEKVCDDARLGRLKQESRILKPNII